MPTVPDNEKILAVVVDADEFGWAQAAAKHDVSRRTIFNYRERIAEDPELQKQYAETKKHVLTAMVARVGRAQETILKKMEELTAKADNLNAVTQAFKVVSETFLAQSVMSGTTEPKESTQQKAPHGRPSGKTSEMEDARRALRQNAEGRIYDGGASKLPQ